MKMSFEDLLYVTLSYADIFDYPLTSAELRLFSLSKFTHLLKKIRGVELKIVRGKKYYFLLGREEVLAKRIHREQYAREKWRKAAIIARAIGRIPTVCLVGVTGGLAMSNTTPEDDIDLYCVTEKNTLWITRFLVTLLVSLLGVRRVPTTKRVKDLFCLNMFTTVEGMRVPKSERDLFSAHEVVQMVPLWEKKGAYKKFLHDNQWVENYLPNAWRKKNAKWQMSNDKLKRNNYIFSIYHLVFVMFEPLARILQLWYMRDKRTHEVISSQTVRFHPTDARVWIKKKLQKRLKKMNIPLDTIFYRQ